MTTCPPLRVKLLDPDARPPERKTPLAGGLDLYAPAGFTVPRGRILQVGLGLSVKVPDGYAGQICGRSSLEVQGLHALGTRVRLADGSYVLAGLIDADYVGELGVVFKNLGVRDVTVARHARCAQLVIKPVALCAVELVDELPGTARGAGGFGSTGA